MFQPIEVREFEERTGLHCSDLDSAGSSVKKVVSLRGVAEISSVSLMKTVYLIKLIRSVRLVGDSRKRPYADSEITVVSMDPRQLRIGQTFAQRKKYQVFMEEFPNLFQAFCGGLSGLSRFQPMVILGRDVEGESVLAHYLPPVVEAVNGHSHLLDGIHRNFVILQAGASIESVLIRNPSSPFPAELHSWDKLRIVDQKPPLEERYFKLREELFRDLKFVGVDG